MPAQFILPTVKHSFSIVYKPKKSNCRIKLVGVGTDLVFNKGAEDIRKCKLGDNEIYSCLLYTSILALGIINNEPINHINTKDILGNTEKAVLNIYFYSEVNEEICRLETVITSKNVKVEGVVYQIDSESLWTKNIEEVTTRKAMLDFDGREPIIVRNEQESFLSDDVSIRCV